MAEDVGGAPVERGPVAHYDGFISYSHQADGALATRLHTALELYGKPWYRLRALRMFRDENDLAAAPGLWTEIEQALSSSNWFIYLASTAAAASPWCTRECVWWLTHRSAERMLIVLTDGDLAWDPGTERCDVGRTTALPPAVAGLLAQEPLYVDLRWAREEPGLTLDNVRFRSAVLDLAAPLHGLAKAAMDSEAVRANRRNRRWVAGTLVLLAMLTVAALAAAMIARSESVVANQRARAAKRAVLIAAARSFPDDPTRAGALIRETTELPAQFKRTAKILQGHTSAIRTLAFSPDGKLLITGSDDRTARVWKTDGSGDPVVLRGHTGPIRVALFDDTGRRALTASEDGTARLWSLDSGTEPIVLRSATDGIYAASWSAGGSVVLTGSRRQSTFTLFDDAKDKTPSVRRWELNSSAPPKELGPPVEAVAITAFSADGSKVAIASNDQMISVLPTQGPGTPLRLKGPAGGITSLALSQDGSLIIAGSKRGPIQVWAVDKPLKPRWLVGHDQAVPTLMSVSRGNQLLSGSDDGTVRLWDLSSGVQVSRFSGHRGGINALALSPDGKSAVSASADRTARIWRLDGSNPDVPVELLSRFQSEAEGTFGAAFMREMLAPIGSSALLGNSLAQPEDELPGHDSGLLAVAWSPDGSQIATSSADGTARLWQANLPKAGRPFRLYAASAPKGLALDRDGELLLRWDESSATLERTDGSKAAIKLAGVAQRLTAAALSPSGRLVLTGSSDGKLRLWRAGEGHLLELAQWSSGAPADFVGFDPSETQLAVISQQVLRLWDIADPRHPSEAAKIEGARSASYSVDGKYVLVQARDVEERYAIQVLNTKDRREVRELHRTSPEVSARSSGGFRLSRDGSQVIACASRGRDTPTNLYDRWSIEGRSSKPEETARYRYNPLTDALDRPAGGSIFLYSDGSTQADPCDEGPRLVATARSPNGRKEAFGLAVPLDDDRGAGVIGITVKDWRTLLWQTVDHCIASKDRVQLLGESAADAERAQACCQATMSACRDSTFGECSAVVTRNYSDVLRPCHEPWATTGPRAVLSGR